MSSPSIEMTSTQHTTEEESSTQNVELKIPFVLPQIGPLQHILQVTGEKGSSKEYDSFSDNRP